ncbi:MAG: hypothetical protein IT385_22075 [Deltaproteobacteria bacterium]|nr:hypothetical protein [Deltaproteobacteria bacterium]
MSSLIVLALAWPSEEASAEGGRFFLFVAGDEAPSQALVESAWREARKVESFEESAVARERIGRAFPRLFDGTRAVDKKAIEADLRAGKAAYFATEFELAETHLARALAAVDEAPEMLAGAAAIVPQLADAAALRYANARARKLPEAEARAALRDFIARYASLTPSPTEHAADVVELWSRLRAELPMGSLMVSAVPLELDRSGTCRLLVNGLVVSELPMPGPARLPHGEHLVHVRCGLTASWVQRVTVGASALAIAMPVRAMVAARADHPSGGIVLVSPSEGDSAALVDALAAATGLDGAVVVRPGAPKRVEFGVWRADIDAPTLLAAGTMSPDGITDVRAVQADAGPARALSPWPFVIAGAGVGALVGGVVTNVGYLDDRDAGVQDLDATPSVVLYGVGGALVATGVVLFILDVTGDDEAAALTVTGPGRVAFRF